MGMQGRSSKQTHRMPAGVGRSDKGETEKKERSTSLTPEGERKLPRRSRLATTRGIAVPKNTGNGEEHRSRVLKESGKQKLMDGDTVRRHPGEKKAAPAKAARSYVFLRGDKKREKLV